MSCCGKKREQLLQRRVPPEPRAVAASMPEPARPDHRPRVFEYTGRQSLTLRGVASGRTYNFTQPGECVEVAWEDSFAMLAEWDVRVKGGA